MSKQMPQQDLVGMLQQLAGATDLSAYEPSKPGLLQLHALLRELQRSTPTTSKDKFSSIADFLRDSHEAHGKAFLAALQQLNDCSANSGMQHVPPAALEAVCVLLETFITRCALPDAMNQPTHRQLAVYCSYEAFLERTAASQLATTATTVSLLLAALQGDTQPLLLSAPPPTTAAATAPNARQGANAQPLQPEGGLQAATAAQLLDLAALVLWLSTITVPLFHTRSMPLPRGSKGLRTTVLPFVSLAVLLLRRPLAVAVQQPPNQPPPAPAGRCCADSQQHPSNSSVRGLAEPPMGDGSSASAGGSNVGAADGSNAGQQMATQAAMQVAAGGGATVESATTQAAMHSRWATLAAEGPPHEVIQAAMQVASVLAVQLSDMGVIPALPSHIPAALHDSQDLQLLMLVFFALAVQQAHRAAQQQQQQEPQQREEILGHVLLLEALGCSSLTAFDGMVAADPAGLDPFLQGHPVKATLFYAAESCLYSYTSTFPDAWVAGGPPHVSGIPQLPGSSSSTSALAGPTLHRLVQLLDLLPEYEVYYVKHVTKISTGLIAVAAEHYRVLWNSHQTAAPDNTSSETSNIGTTNSGNSSAGGSGSNSSSSSNSGGQGSSSASEAFAAVQAAVQQLADVVLVRLSRKLMELLGDPERDEKVQTVGYRANFARVALSHLVELTKDLPGGVVAQALKQAPATVASLVEAVLRGHAAPLPGYTPNLSGLPSVALSTTKLLLFAISDMCEPSLSAIAAADPAASRALFGALMAALKAMQIGYSSSSNIASSNPLWQFAAMLGLQQREQEQQEQLLAVLMAAGEVCFGAARLADPEFDPINPAYSFNNCKGLAAVLGHSSSSSSTGAGEGTSSGGGSNGGSSGGSGRKERYQLAHLWLVAVGEALHLQSKSLLALLYPHNPSSSNRQGGRGLSGPGPSLDRQPLAAMGIATYVRAVQWLGVALPQLQLPGQAAAAAAASDKLCQQQAALLSLLDVGAADQLVAQLSARHGPDATRTFTAGQAAAPTAAAAATSGAFVTAGIPEALMRRAVPAEALQLGEVLGAGLCAALPLPLLCNNIGSCSNMSCMSEVEMLGSKPALCSGCKSAKYCCRQCQAEHWERGHKATCQRLRRNKA